MSKILPKSLKIILPLQLAACGSDTPSFTEKPQAVIRVAVNQVDDPSTVSGESFDFDTLMDEGSSASESKASADSTVDTNLPSTNGEGSSEGVRDAIFDQGRPRSIPKPQPWPDPDGTAGNIDNIPGSSPIGSSDALPRTTPAAATIDTKTVAKACAPSMRNLGKALTVHSIDDSTSSIAITPDSVIAFKITGDRVQVVLDLDSQTPLAGVCFFLAGHEPELQFSSASAVNVLAVMEVGDQAKGQIILKGGSPETLSVDMRGNNATLVIEGVNTSLCETAVIKNPNQSFSCKP